MNIKINNLTSVILMLIVTFASAKNHAAESHFEIRADGLACPYCAYGIEKKFMQIDGVKHLDIDLKKGLVLVTGDENLIFQPSQLKTLFTDSGFTFRSIKKVNEEQSSTINQN